MLLYRKIFGDDTKGAAETTKKLRITTKTTYRLMMKQAGSGISGEGGQVCLGTRPTTAKLLTIPQDTPLNRTFPRWTQRNTPKVPGGPSLVSDIAQIWG